jgi:hypothetical protein
MSTLDEFQEVPLDELYRITKNLMLWREEINPDDVQREVSPRSASKYNPHVFKRLVKEGLIIENGTTRSRRTTNHYRKIQNYKVV